VNFEKDMRKGKRDKKKKRKLFYTKEYDSD
jgi:hypothetical protein